MTLKGLVTLALDSSGFSRRSRILPGNVSEPSALQQMTEQLCSPIDATVGKQECTWGNCNHSPDLRPIPTIVMDAGIASDENIQWLQDNDYKYIVVSRKRRMQFDEERRVAVK